MITYIQDNCLQLNNANIIERAVNKSDGNLNQNLIL